MYGVNDDENDHVEKNMVERIDVGYTGKSSEEG